MAVGGDGLGRLLAVPFSKRLVIAVIAAVGFVWVLLQSHSIKPVREKYRSLYSNNILNKINNSTLGVRMAATSTQWG